MGTLMSVSLLEGMLRVEALVSVRVDEGLLSVGSIVCVLEEEELRVGSLGYGA